MCLHLKFGDGSTAIICGVRGENSTVFCVCGRQATALCDWKVPFHNSGTCDVPLCADHAQQVARGKHLCPEHQRAFAAWKLRHPPAQGELFSEAI